MATSLSFRHHGKLLTTWLQAQDGQRGDTTPRLWTHQKGIHQEGRLSQVAQVGRVAQRGGRLCCTRSAGTGPDIIVSAGRLPHHHVIALGLNEPDVGME